MYEAHFGFSGPPFQLVPDPGFFFGSRGHSNALAFLQSAAQQGDGFLIVTGEIGAGKTTLVRTLLDGLDAARIRAATMVSTQLEAGELPQAILLAFGVVHSAKSRTEVAASLEAFLVELASQGRRALLIVDEAQNLGHGLLEELRLLSNLQAGVRALLQVFLVGQPELRPLIQAKSMEQLRQRVTASCHLGPLDANETQAYIQHRLRRVGWQDKPAIEAQAYPLIHQWTAGIPRRINRLCNRLLLAAFLERRDTIVAAAVEQVARDLRSEIGESDEPTPMQESYVSAPPTAARAAGVVPPQGVAAPPAASPQEPPSAKPEDKPAAPPITEEDEEADSRFASAFGSDWAELPVSPFAAVRPPSPRDASGKEVSTRIDGPAARGKDLPGIVAAHEAPPVPLVPPAKRDPGKTPPATKAARAAAAQAAPPIPAATQTPPKAQVPAPVRAPAVAATPVSTPPASAAPASSAPAHPRAENVAPLRVAQPAVANADARAGLAADTRMPAAPALSRPVLEPLVLLVDSAGEYVKARALARTMDESRNLPPVLIVHTGSASGLQVGEELAGVMPQSAQDLHLDINEHGGAASAALAITRFDALLRAYRPKALVAMGASDTVLTCTLFAHKSGVAVLRNDAGRRRAWSRPGEEMNAILLEQLADCSYIGDLATYYTLYRAGIPTERVLLVGNLADNVVHCAAQHVVHPRSILARAAVPAEWLERSSGYALCSAQIESPRGAPDEAAELITLLTQVAQELPVVWAATPSTLRELEALGKLAALPKARIQVAAALPYLDCIDLLRGARCLISGSAGRFLDDAVALGVPSIVLGKGVVVPVKSTEALQLGSALPAEQLPEVLADVLGHQPAPRDDAPFWDGGAAGRIATHLAEWLPQRAAGAKHDGQGPATVKPVERNPVRSEFSAEAASAG
jgi:putative secretion ATPase (PEP-CTERM system associated)